MGGRRRCWTLMAFGCWWGRAGQSWWRRTKCARPGRRWSKPRGMSCGCCSPVAGCGCGRRHWQPRGAWTMRAKPRGSARRHRCIACYSAPGRTAPAGRTGWTGAWKTRPCSRALSTARRRSRRMTPPGYGGTSPTASRATHSLVAAATDGMAHSATCRRAACADHAGAAPRCAGGTHGVTTRRCTSTPTTCTIAAGPLLSI